MDVEIVSETPVLTFLRDKTVEWKILGKRENGRLVVTPHLAPNSPLTRRLQIAMRELGAG